MADAGQVQDDPSDFIRHIAGDPRRITQYTVRNSDGVHLAGNNRPAQENAKTSAEKYMALLANVDMLPEDDSRKKWATELQKICMRNGKHVNGPVDIGATLKRMNDAFDLLKSARKQVGVSTDDHTLTEKQQEKAHQWLQYQVFEQKFMTNKNLMRRIQEFNARPNSLKGTARKKCHDDRRGAFKVWKFQLLGSAALLLTVLRHGIFEAGDH